MTYYFLNILQVTKTDVATKTWLKTIIINFKYLSVTIKYKHIKNLLSNYVQSVFEVTIFAPQSNLRQTLRGHFGLNIDSVCPYVLTG